MTQNRSWQERTEWIAGLLERRTGDGIDAWNAKIQARDPADEASLRSWLTEQGVTGYPQMLLVMERFGYPDYLVAGSDELIDGQYADRPALRPILDVLLDLAPGLGDVSIQTRKGFVTLVSPRRTFASIEPTTKARVDLGLRLDGQVPTGRLEVARNMGNSSVTHRIGLTTPDDIDDELIGWLQAAYDANC
jgi:hypothetical protein